MKKFFSEIFAYDGRFMEAVTKFGELVMLSVVFLICCLPVVTIGPAVTSLYYAVIKSVRRERGTPLSEFFSSMKRVLGKGALMTFEAAVCLTALYAGYRQSAALGTKTGSIFATVYVILLGILAFMTVYIFPILSRFTMKHTSMWLMSFVMSLRFFPVTAAIIGGTVLLGWLQIYILPIPCILFVPGCWCYAVTFMMEKALLHYMPKPKEGEDAWYYAKKNSFFTSESDLRPAAHGIMAQWRQTGNKVEAAGQEVPGCRRERGRE